MIKPKKSASNVVWFEIPADNPARANQFYGKLFGWKINAMPHMEGYWHLDTGGPDASPDGAVITRKGPQHTVTNYVSVPSVNRAAAKVEKLGGKVCMPKTAVPGMGYFAVCLESEGKIIVLIQQTYSSCI